MPCFHPGQKRKTNIAYLTLILLSRGKKLNALGGLSYCVFCFRSRFFLYVCVSVCICLCVCVCVCACQVCCGVGWVLLLLQMWPKPIAPLCSASVPTFAHTLQVEHPGSRSAYTPVRAYTYTRARRHATHTRAHTSPRTTIYKHTHIHAHIPSQSRRERPGTLGRPTRPVRFGAEVQDQPAKREPEVSALSNSFTLVLCNTKRKVLPFSLLDLITQVLQMYSWWYDWRKLQFCIRPWIKVAIAPDALKIFPMFFFFSYQNLIVSYFVLVISQTIRILKCHLMEGLALVLTCGSWRKCETDAEHAQRH